MLDGASGVSGIQGLEGKRGEINKALCISPEPDFDVRVLDVGPGAGFWAMDSK